MIYQWYIIYKDSGVYSWFMIFRWVCLHPVSIYEKSLNLTSVSTSIPISHENLIRAARASFCLCNWEQRIFSGCCRMNEANYFNGKGGCLANYPGHGMVSTMSSGQGATKCAILVSTIQDMCERKRIPLFKNNFPKSSVSNIFRFF